MAGDDALTLRPHQDADLDWLAQMNRALIDASGGRSGLSHAGFVARFRSRAEDGYLIEVFEQAGERVGFASHQARTFPDGVPYIHLAQFHIASGRRRQGLGSQAFRLLAATRWPKGARIELQVLDSNPTGRRFWESLGFHPFSATLEITLPENPS